MRRVGIFGTIALGLLGLVRLELLVVIGVNAVGIDKICIKEAASHVGFRHWQLVLLVQVLQHYTHGEEGRYYHLWHGAFPHTYQ